MATVPKVVLTIAGFDPGSGAGISADLKTIAAHSCFGVACITAVTVQNTQGVSRVEPVDPSVITQTLEGLASDIPIAAVRVGMLGDRAQAEAVAGFLERRKLPNLVLDPVLRSSSGTVLTSERARQVMVKRLLPLAVVVTPNAPEAAELTGLPVRTLADATSVARKLQVMGARNVVLKGGHLPENTDYLLTQCGEEHRFAGQRLENGSTHGTGCAFATAIACNLAMGNRLEEAIATAKAYVAAAIRTAVPLGGGRGPINHFPSNW